MSIISVEHVTKEFTLGQSSLRQALTNTYTRLRGGTIQAQPPFNALKDVSFSVDRGEVLGLIGTNGAGKSTILKLLARITTPTSGGVRVLGKIAPLIEVGAGLIGDLTGRENVYLNGIILGMPYAAIKRKFDEIVAFAELEEFIDTPIKRYSSGMAVRLGFSIATAVDADILIVDEVLAVGDLAFQRKCFDRMEELIRRQGKTVILVSHNTRQVERLCKRVILMDRGQIVADGASSAMCQLFHERSDEKIKADSASRIAVRGTNISPSGDVDVLKVELLDIKLQPIAEVFHEAAFIVRIVVAVKNSLKVPTFAIGVHTTDFLYLATHSSQYELKIDVLSPGTYTMLCRINRCVLVPGVYGLRLGIADGVGGRDVFYGENLAHFLVKAALEKPLPESDRQGFFSLEAQWDAPTRATDPTSQHEAPAPTIRVGM